MLDEYGCELIYITGKTSKLVDALSRLVTENNDDTKESEEICRRRRTFENGISNGNVQNIATEQQKYKTTKYYKLDRRKELMCN